MESVCIHCMQTGIHGSSHLRLSGSDAKVAGRGRASVPRAPTKIKNILKGA